MTVTEAVLIVALCVAIVLCAVLIFTVISHKRNAERLTRSIEKFIQDGTPIDFSVSDNYFSRLQNGVADLENIIKLEKSNTLSETKKNTEFISDISHQLKTPLAGLRLYCEMENAENPTEHTQKELQLIEKMEGLIQKLLRLEKIKSDAYVMDIKDYEVHEIVSEALAEFRHLFPNKHYSLNGSRMLRCDKSWLSEALGNIIKNASEHTPDDGIVAISIEGGSRSTTIEISDNGGGIPEHEIPNLFLRFFRADNANPSNAGIGLAITKAIVDKHHGIINAENKNGGLSVMMCFPHIDGYVAI